MCNCPYFPVTFSSRIASERTPCLRLCKAVFAGKSSRIFNNWLQGKCPSLWCVPAPTVEALSSRWSPGCPRDAARHRAAKSWAKSALKPDKSALGLSPLWATKEQVGKLQRRQVGVRFVHFSSFRNMTLRLRKVTRVTKNYF